MERWRREYNQIRLTVSDEEALDKYMRCTLGILSQSRAGRVIETILSPEKVHDISELMTICNFSY